MTPVFIIKTYMRLHSRSNNGNTTFISNGLNVSAIASGKISEIHSDNNLTETIIFNDFVVSKQQVITKVLRFIKK